MEFLRQILRSLSTESDTDVFGDAENEDGDDHADIGRNDDSDTNSDDTLVDDDDSAPREIAIIYLPSECKQHDDSLEFYTETNRERDYDGHYGDDDGDDNGDDNGDSRPWRRCHKSSTFSSTRQIPGEIPKMSYLMSFPN